MTPHTSSRREFLASLGLGAAGAVLVRSAAAAEGTDLVAGIEKATVRRGRDGSGPTWFHPRACIVPSESGSTAFMTLQTIAGSDYFGPVHWMTSSDLGRTWTEPQPVPPLGRVKQSDGSEEGVCDVVPQWHAATKTVLALGHNVFYSGPRFSADQPPRWPVYAVWRDGQWGPRRKLEWGDPRGASIYSNGCGQRVVLPDGDILMAFTHGGEKKKPRSVSGVICSFDGDTLAVKRVGEEIAHDKGRGLLEPSITEFRGRFFLTLRAEDNRGYVCSSDDGLHWTAKQPWAWDDGEPLVLSTTQQHWLPHSEALWLVYTRKDACNVNVIRWRSPLWMAQVDTHSLRLRRDTERVVLPLVGDGVNDPDRVALMGNFHTTNASPAESWVTVGEWQPKNGIKGDLLLARIRWNKLNELVGKYWKIRRPP
ncbi:MAG: exo-alpha-sialidase [Pirellulales bacterium]|nr:exo-alpha-sialidase [Pirellulales bacterium]